MKLYLPTSNDYVDLVPENVARLQRHWPDVDVTVLCYDKIPDLPKGVDFYPMGEQALFGRSWTDALRTYFSAVCRHDYFVIWLDDYYINSMVDTRRIAILENFVKEGVDKADLTDDRAKFRHSPFAGHDELIVSDQMARYRSSLQAAIWRREYFLSYLKPSRDAWAFELEGYREHLNDGATIIGYRKPVVVYENVMLKGEVFDGES